MSKKKRSRPSGQTGAASGETESTFILPPCPDCGAPVTGNADGDVAVDHIPGCPLHLAIARAREADSAWFAANPDAPFLDRVLVPAEADFLRYRFPALRAGDALRVIPFESGFCLHWLPRADLNLLIAPREGAA